MRYIEILKSRYKLIIKYSGVIIMIIAGSILLPLMALLSHPGDVIYAPYFIYTAILTFIFGLAMFYLPGTRPETVTLTLTEGGIIVVLSWFFAIIFSAIPFVWGLGMSWTHSIFEVVSGWTTTGLTVVTESETPGIYLLWRSIMQMLGGAGLAVIALSSLLPMQGMGLYHAEGRTDKLLPHVSKSTKMIMQIYLGYIIAGTFLYFVSGMSLFDAVNHSMAAISTGGFSTVGPSIGYWDSIKVELVTIVLMFLGTINFATHYTLLQGKYKSFLRNAEIKLMGILLGIFIPLVTFFSLGTIYSNFGESLREVTFQLISALSTTGFSTIDFNLWPIFSVLIVIFFMIVGGGTGSTAGGIKQFRVYLIFKSIFWEIKNQFLPASQVKEYYIWRGEEKWYIKSEQIKEIANYIILYLFTYFIGVLIFLSQGFSLGDSMFEFASALGTVGLSVGITAADVSPVILWTEIAGMLLGRLEFVIIIIGITKILRDTGYLIGYKNKS